MIPLIVLALSFAVFWLTGFRVGYFADWQLALRASLGVMFLLTASAHWGKAPPRFDTHGAASFWQCGNVGDSYGSGRDSDCGWTSDSESGVRGSGAGGGDAGMHFSGQREGGAGAADDRWTACSRAGNAVGDSDSLPCGVGSSGVAPVKWKGQLRLFSRAKATTSIVFLVNVLSRGARKPESGRSSWRNFL